MGARPQYADVEKLVDELFGEIEHAQGYAFVSDGETFSTTEQFFERIRGRLRYQRKAARIMAAFLRRHGQYNPPQGST